MLDTRYLAIADVDQPQREAMAMLFLDLHRYGYVIGWIFGPWLFFFGLLVFKSGFLPRILGVLLIAACLGYLADGLRRCFCRVTRTSWAELRTSR